MGTSTEAATAATPTIQRDPLNIFQNLRRDRNPIKY